MFGKMMDRFYYGKSGKGDYTKDDLPETRWQLFWEMLKIRAAGLCRLNVLYALAWLPALAVVAMAVTRGYSALAGMAELQETAAQGAISAEALAEGMAQFSAWIRGLVLQTLLLLIPCIAVTGPFTAGIALITRNWARDEHAFVWSDYRDAVKENWKQGLAVSSITAVMPLMLYVCWTFYGEMAQENLLFLLPQVLSSTLVLVWLCSLLYQYPLMVSYRLRLRDLLRNGVLLTLGRMPMTAGLKLLTLIPGAIAAAVAFFTPYLPYALLVLLLYYVMIGFALSRFIGASYANAVFDRFINAKLEGVQVNRGLYQDDEDEQSDEGEE